MNRPGGVVISAVLVALSGLAVFGSGALQVMSGGPALFSGMVSLLFGAALLYLAWGLWTLQTWSWTTTLIVEAINGIFSLVGLLSSPGAMSAWLTLAIAVIVIYYLMQPSVRAAFSQQPVNK